MKPKELAMQAVCLDEDERDLLKLMLKARDMDRAFYEIENEIFRPARKHGYPEREIRELVLKIGSNAEELIGLLEQKYYDIKVTHSI